MLSADDIDALLSGINTRNNGAAGDNSATDNQAKTKVRLYDWKHPPVFSREQIRIISNIHEIFTRLTATCLSVETQTDISLYVASVDQLTYEEFIRSIPSPTLVSVINMNPLKGPAVLEIDPSVSFALVQLLLGAQNTVQLSKNREHTDIEQNVLESVFVQLLSVLRESWSSVLDLRPTLSELNTNPLLVQIVPYTEMCILITMVLKAGDECEGMMNLCIPWLTLEPILHKLQNTYWYGKTAASTQNLVSIKNALSTRSVTIWGDYELSQGPVTLDTLQEGKAAADAIPAATGYIVTGGNND